MSRVATFSSSSIHNLLSKGRGNFSIENIGKPFTTYVEEKVMEKNLERSLSSENSARPTAWGTLVEEHAFSKMGLEYSLVSKERFYKGDYWSGMPDLITPEIVGDIKCPWTLKGFCKLVKSMNEGVESFKDNHPEYYWQLVSNSILCKRDKAMIVCYVPYKEDLEDIRQLAEDHMGDLNNRFSFIQWADDEELPYLIEGNKYNDINVMEFDVPESDKNILTMRVAMAVKEFKKQTS
jgi:hypothetical protein